MFLLLCYCTCLMLIFNCISKQGESWGHTPPTKNTDCKIGNLALRRSVITKMELVAIHFLCLAVFHEAVGQLYHIYVQWLCCVQQLHPGLLWGLRMVPSELHIHKQLRSIWTTVGERYVLQTQQLVMVHHNSIDCIRKQTSRQTNNLNPQTSGYPICMST